MSCDLVKVSEEARERGIFVVYTTVELRGRVDGDPLGGVVSDYVAYVRSSLTLEGLKDHPVVRAYRDFFWRLGIDPTKVRPSSEALARRALRGEFPRVSPLVDAGNLASLRTLVPIGIYDLDLASPPLTITLSRQRVKFYPIGGREQELPEGYPIMVDSRGVVVHLYAHRDSSLTSVRESTRRALIVGTGVPGVGRELVGQAVDLTVRLSSAVGWAQEGPACEA